LAFNGMAPVCLTPDSLVLRSTEVKYSVRSSLRTKVGSEVDVIVDSQFGQFTNHHSCLGENDQGIGIIIVPSIRMVHALRHIVSV
jgi:hypothetical protein